LKKTQLYSGDAALLADDAEQGLSICLCWREWDFDSVESGRRSQERHLWLCYRLKDFGLYTL